MKICEYCGKEIRRVTSNVQKYHKECKFNYYKKYHKKYNPEYYQKNKEKIKKQTRNYYFAKVKGNKIKRGKRRKYERKYYKRNKKKFNNYDHKWYQKNKLKVKGYIKKYRKNNKKGVHARALAERYIKIPKGQICQYKNCKKLAVLRHHPDYDKPLKVKFLCTSCHGKLRRKD